MFGVTSPEKYYQSVRNALKGSLEVASIAGDLIIYDKGVDKHDRYLFVVLDRLSEVELTVNGEKCAF